jgi:hypothetical protein
MNALLQKDRAWLLFLLAAGAAALAASLLEHSFLYAFVVSSGRLETLFYMAMSVGLLLGAVAACFDECLGTRELLAQRPVGPATIVRARIHACAVVLVGWFLLTPFSATLAFWLKDPQFEFGVFRQVPAHYATMTAAVSAAGIGFAAGSLPFSWWVRLPCAGAALLVTYSAIFWLAADERRDHDAWAWAALHVLAGVAFFAAGAVASRWRRDPDLPRVAATRAQVVGPWLVLAAALACVLLREFADNALARLRSEYPRAVVHDGRVVLVDQEEWRGPMRLVDDLHRPTGITIDHDAARGLQHSLPGLGGQFVRIEAPRFGMPARSGGWVHEIVIDNDGSVFMLGKSGLRVVGRGAEQEPFAPGSRIATIAGDGSAVVADAGTGALWRYDDGRGHFEPLPLPDGDRFVEFTRLDAQVQEAVFPASNAREVVGGERGVYGVRDGRLQRVGEPRPRRGASDADQPVARVEGDVMSWRLVFDGQAGVAAWQHEFTPRTGTERGYAYTAMVLSLLRPPLLQATAAFLAPPDRRWHTFVDPLVVDGRRDWLVVSGIAAAMVFAWLVRRRLVRLGADRGTQRFWTVATLLLGPFAAAISVFAETERAWAVRKPLAPRAPRIASLPVGQEALP